MDLPDLPSGQKPHQFTLDDDSNEFYMMGSEAGAYMGLFRGAIYKKFPNLWRRLATAEERKRIYSVINDPQMKVATNVTLVKAADIANIVLGNDQEYRATFNSLIEKMEAKSMKDSQLNSTINGSFWPTNLNFDINNECALTMNDFNIFSIPISQLSVVKRVPISKKKMKCSSIFLEWKYSKNLYAKLNSIKDELIPIRLYIKYDPYFLNDIFFWNKSTEFLLDYCTFSELLCDDYDLPSDVFVPAIVDLIKCQVERYERDKHLLEIYKRSNKSITDTFATINLDINIGETRLQDKFQWDINKDNPKWCIQFAEIIVKELKISPEFIVPISVCILGQLHWHRHIRYFKLGSYSKSTEKLSNYSSTITTTTTTAINNGDNNNNNVKHCGDEILPIQNDISNNSNVQKSLRDDLDTTEWSPILTNINGKELDKHQIDIHNKMLRIKSCITSYSNKSSTFG